MTKYDLPYAYKELLKRNEVIKALESEKETFMMAHNDNRREIDYLKRKVDRLKKEVKS